MFKCVICYVADVHECGTLTRGNCSHTCLPSSLTTYRCVCPDAVNAMQLDDDNKTCTGNLIRVNQIYLHILKRRDINHGDQKVSSI